MQICENNDERENSVEKSQETEFQRKKREEREKAEKEREEERARIFELMENNINPGFWDGGAYDNDEEVGDEEDHENISVNSLAGKDFRF